MPTPSPAPGSTAQESSEAGSQGQVSGDQSLSNRAGGGQERAARGPIAEPVSAAENPVPSRPADSPAEAQGRRILSTAFVMVGPDGQLTVKLRNGRVFVLRDVVMRANDYCGVQVLGGKAGARFCGGYAEVAAARPGGAPAPQEPDLAPSNPLESASDRDKQN